MSKVTHGMCLLLPELVGGSFQGSCHALKGHQCRVHTLLHGLKVVIHRTCMHQSHEIFHSLHTSVTCNIHSLQVFIHCTCFDQSHDRSIGCCDSLHLHTSVTQHTRHAVLSGHWNCPAAAVCLTLSINNTAPRR